MTIKVKGKNKFIGLYDDETAAARAYGAYVVRNSIDKNLNFPDAPATARAQADEAGRGARATAA